MLLFGADRAAQFPALLPGRVALLTAPSGRTADNRSTIEVLRECCNLVLLLAPEHGVRGDKPAGALIDDETDPESGLPVRSLYQKHSKRLSPETLAQFDTLVYDIADVGCRYYTFISSLRYCLEDCAAAGKKLTVLDRPNPLGDRVEGGLLRQETASFVGCWPIPVCYGLTCGEIARLFNEEGQIRCDLSVIPCENLTREMTFRDWNLPWVMPSPNIPRYETALLYPGTCLIEGTNCSEGRGTADPFAIIGAPFIRAEAFCRAFNAMKLPGVVATPVYFTPTCSKHQGVLCGGIHLHILDEKFSGPWSWASVCWICCEKITRRISAFWIPSGRRGDPFSPCWQATGNLRTLPGMQMLSYAGMRRKRRTSGSGKKPLKCIPGGVNDDDSRH